MSGQPPPGQPPSNQPSPGDDEVSPGGSKLLRYPQRTIPARSSDGDGDLIDAVSDHMERHIGEIHLVFHEVVSDLVHVDVHWIAPGPNRPYHTLFTTGMAEAPMNVPEGVTHRYAEMLTMLPSDWPLSQDSFKNEAHYWPVRWLKTCARLPHEYDTWFGPGHTMPNGDPPEPFAPGTPLCGVIAITPFMLPEEAQQVRPGSRAIQLLYMLPLTAAEMQFKLDEGSDALYDKFEALRLPPHEMALPGRPCAVAGARKRRKWWPFK